jgi:hypothetical protein
VPVSTCAPRVTVDTLMTHLSQTGAPTVVQAAPEDVAEAPEEMADAPEGMPAAPEDMPTPLEGMADAPEDVQAVPDEVTGTPVEGTGMAALAYVAGFPDALNCKMQYLTVVKSLPNN